MIVVFDISGRTTALEHVTRNDRIELNVQKLKKGIYFVELKTTGDRKIMKLVKQ
ncbi:MAG: T9SS type A sorting domain-containing protein [Bacteroidota bacterium]